MSQDRKPDTRPTIILAVVALACLAATLAPPLAQWASYHDFADQRRILGIPNFLDVVSSIAILIAGGFGLRKGNTIATDRALRPAYLVFFASIALVGIGSVYYHLAPSNSTLVWDRIPMAVAFMAFMALVIGEFISSRAGAILLLPLVVLGFLSVGYWHLTELQGQGDLRPYALVQFLPLLLVPLIMLLYRARLVDNRYLLGILVCVLFAKTAELLDRRVFEITGIISGHTVKHLASALGAYCVYLWLRQRHNRETPSEIR
ncbi:MAG: alkaline phytoceramidase [Halobacteria archaeon]|nr:alkaline phytoceramidase [Halobacteria archaeon]